MSKIKNNLPNLLRDKHLNQSDLSKMSGVSFTTISGIFHQKMFPSEKTILAICKVLECNIGDLFDIPQEKKNLIELIAS